MTAPVLPAPPVLVRTDLPGEPLTWIDPAPHVPDEYGHVWTYHSAEPDSPYCLLCCDAEPGNWLAVGPCREAGLLSLINEDRSRWIAERRVEEMAS